MPEQSATRSDNFVQLTFLSKPENVAFARVAIAAFAAQLPFTLEEIDEIKVATSEAVSNCVIHGYPDSLGIVTLRADLRCGVADCHNRAVVSVQRCCQPGGAGAVGDDLTCMRVVGSDNDQCVSVSLRKLQCHLNGFVEIDSFADLAAGVGSMVLLID